MEDAPASNPTTTPKKKAGAGNAFAMMMSSSSRSPKASEKKAPRKRAAPKSSSTSKASAAAAPRNRNAMLKTAYTDGEGLPVLSHPQDMFDDLLTKAPEFAKVIETLNRPLRIATMCSGTESPVLALDMMSRAAEEQVRRGG